MRIVTLLRRTQLIEAARRFGLSAEQIQSLVFEPFDNGALLVSGEDAMFFQHLIASKCAYEKT